MGLWSSTPRAMIPYSVSIPITVGTATTPPSGAGKRATLVKPAYRMRGAEGSPEPGALGLQVLAGLEPLDRAALSLLGLADQGADVDDALALLAGNLGPVIGIRGVRQVLVLPVLLHDRLQKVLGLQPPLADGDQPLDGQLLGPADDVLHHRPGGEVLE